MTLYDRMVAQGAFHPSESHLRNHPRSWFESLAKAMSDSFVHVEHFGAVGSTGTPDTDETGAWQDAIDYAEANNLAGVLAAPRAYQVTSLRVKKPMLLQGAWWGQDAASLLPTNFGYTKLVRKPGSGQGAMVVARSDVSGQFLFGFAMRNFQMDLSNIAAGIDLDGVSKGVLDNIYIATVTNDDYAIRLRSCQFASLRKLDLAVSGIKDGLWLDGETEANSLGAGVTQSKIYETTISYGAGPGGGDNHGACILEGNADNNNIYHLHTISAGGTNPSVSGNWGLVFRDGTGAIPRKNVIHYMVGPVRNQTDGSGNIILYMAGEQGAVSLETGSSIMHWRAADFTTSGLYQTPLLAVRDRLYVSAGEFSPITVSGGAAPTFGSFYTDRFSSLVFPDVNVARAGWNKTVPLNWGDGTLTGVILHHTVAGTVADSKKIRFILKAGITNVADDAASFHGVDFTEGFSVEVNDTTDQANSVSRDDLTFATPITISPTNTEELLLSLTVERDPTHADDNLAEDWHLIGVTLLFSGGPSGGFGPWDYGARGV